MFRENKFQGLYLTLNITGCWSKTCLNDQFMLSYKKPELKGIQLIGYTPKRFLQAIEVLFLLW